MDNDKVLFGEINFRNQRSRFGIKQGDRDRHMYVIGKTGMGKTEILKNMVIQDIQAGRGVAFIDPHGDTADDLPNFVPKERIKDVIIFDPSDLDFPIAFNVMDQVDDRFRHLVASGLLGVFKKVFGIEVFSARMEYILNNTILALLEFPGATILGINRMLAEKQFREAVVEKITDPLVKAFWTQEFAKYTDRLASEATASVQNKVGQFTSSSLIRNILGQVHSTLDVRKVMDEKKILIMNLSRGKIGEDVSRLLGAMMITKIQLAAMSRADIPEKERASFYLYVDEFQHFATESFANILSEARKFALNLVIAHQYIAQMEEEVQKAVFGNVGTIVTFRIGAEDAEILEKEFAPDFTENDLVNLAKWQIYLKLMIDGVASRAFSANTLPPWPRPDISYAEEILAFSRETYAHPKEEVEKQIGEWSAKLIQPEIRKEPPQRPYSQFQQPFQPREKVYGSGVYPRLPTQQKPASLQEAIRSGPVDFRGRKIMPPAPVLEKKPTTSSEKATVDLQSLRQTLGQIVNKNTDLKDKDESQSK
ncbi:MAG: type IV secretion system DNA-binding domain-containing protein [Candidatus Yanofskybacteria bacterium]|nr:type IV secretion system DNA-binding domain-containing protein [Candidatus Yanofskybacteria bacterium]